ncbi:hypothetical protein [Tumebacillus avium]|uniref:hypothetical protein n=1 Tax=Tumebacillus avium TaxID=1903704 RepID=UPI0012FE25C1|nr:hypothetical protein [Tumebacillus avium]
MDFKMVSLYSASNGDLYILPRGISKKWGGAIIDLELPHFLESGYTDQMLESDVKQVVDDWNVMEPSEELKPSVIEKVVKVKGYVKAVKNMKYVSLEWNVEEGYTVIPTINSGKNGFDHLEDESISCGINLGAGALAQAIRTAIALSK